MYNQLDNKDSYPLTDWILFVLYLITIFLAIFSNSIILTIFIKKRKTSATYVLISNNCVSDLLSALLMILQWYFCSKIFFPDQLDTALILNDNNNQFLNNLTINNINNQQSNLFLKLNSTKNNLSINLPQVLLNESEYEKISIDNNLEKSTNLQVNTEIDGFKQSNKIKSNYQKIQRNQLNNDDNLNKITKYQNKINEQMLNTINNNGKSINDSIKEIIERLFKKINLINSNNDQGILNKLQDNQQISLFKNLNDQVELEELNSFTNQISQKQNLELPNNLENTEEKLKKRFYNAGQSTKSMIDSIIDRTTEAIIDNSESISNNQNQIKNSSKFRNFVNQLINTNKFIKSKFILNKMSNCGQRICGILETLQMSTYFVSTLTMAGIAYNRYNLINRPLAKKINSTLFLISIWSIAVLMSILASLSSLRVFVFFTNRRFIDCQIILSSNDGWYIRKYRAVFIIILQYILPLSCICFLYCKVIKELRNSGFIKKHQSSTSSNNLSMDNYFLFNQNRKLSKLSNTINYNTLPKVNSNLNDEKDVFQINLETKPEIVIKSEPNINNSSKPILNFKSLNLVNLSLLKQLNNSSINDLPVIKQNYIKNKSNESQNTLSSNRSVSAKLNLLDGPLDRTKRRLTKMMIIVVVLFAISWCPVHLANLKQFFIDKHNDINYCNSSFLYLFFYFVAFSTFCYNPIIYMCFSKELRKDAFKTIKFLFKFRFLKFIRFRIREN